VREDAGKQLQQVKLFNSELALAKKLKSGKQAENVAAVKTLAEKGGFSRRLYFTFLSPSHSLFLSLSAGR